MEPEEQMILSEKSQQSKSLELVRLPPSSFVSRWVPRMELCANSVRGMLSVKDSTIAMAKSLDWISSTTKVFIAQKLSCLESVMIGLVVVTRDEISGQVWRDKRYRAVGTLL